MRYLLSILAVIIFVVIAIVIIASSGKHQTNIPVGSKALPTYNYTGTSVSLTTEGELVGESQRVAIRETVSEDVLTVNILSGYEQTISSTETFANTPAAYEAFLQGLQLAGFLASRTTTETYMEGVCPTGETYIYDLTTPSKTVSNLWSTSCSSGDGTMAGNTQLIQQLFQMQISNYSTFTQSVNFDGQS